MNAPVSSPQSSPMSTPTTTPDVYAKTALPETGLRNYWYPLQDRYPHRGAQLSQGSCMYPGSGTLTCLTDAFNRIHDGEEKHEPAYVPIFFCRLHGCKIDDRTPPRSPRLAFTIVE
jgi:hypothetical protein